MTIFCLVLVLLYIVRNNRIHSSAMVFKHEAVKGTDGLPSSKTELLLVKFDNKICYIDK